MNKAGAKRNKCLFNEEKEKERQKEKFISSFIKRNGKLQNIIAGVTFFLSHCYRFLRTAWSSRRVLTSLSPLCLFRTNIFTWIRFNWNSLSCEE